ncbi:FecR family protein [Pedobacter aquatilis]|uniref:FecR family protein n=1 Tax=Pedobacter aquatilis TaxID=351343 RepID=UPI00292E668A|nr:FecR domain-containing protein [Pedobacter aquatilis]
MENKIYSPEELASNESFIAYYLRNDKAAIAYWEKWVSLNPHQIDTLETAKNLLDVLYQRLPEHEFEQERQKMEFFLSKTENTDSEKLPVQTVLRPNRYKTVFAIAATIAILATVTFTVLRYNQYDEAKSEVAEEWTSFTSPISQRSIITLSDSSKVVLNSGSRLDYPKAFKGNNRFVKLVGQAFFEVAHDKAHPFIVKSGNTSTKVLGTSFNLTNEKSTGNVSVALLTGKVKFEIAGKPDKNLVLAPGQMASYTAGNKSVSVKDFDPQTITAWKNGITRFSTADFKTIAATLEQNYGYHLIDKSGIKDLKYTGEFKNQSAMSVIDAVCYSLNLKYTLENKTVTVFKK